MTSLKSMIKSKVGKVMSRALRVCDYCVSSSKICTKGKAGKGRRDAANQKRSQKEIVV